MPHRTHSKPSTIPIFRPTKETHRSHPQLTPPRPRLPERTLGQVFNGLKARREGGHGKEGDEVSSVGRGEDVGREAPGGEEDAKSERGRKTRQAGV